MEPHIWSLRDDELTLTLTPTPTLTLAGKSLADLLRNGHLQRFARCGLLAVGVDARHHGARSQAHTLTPTHLNMNKSMNMFHEPPDLLGDARPPASPTPTA